MLSLFPAAALGAIVIYAAIRLIDLPALRRLYTFRVPSSRSPSPQVQIGAWGISCRFALTRQVV